MKTSIGYFLLLASIALTRAQTPATSGGISASQETPFMVVSQDGNSRVWERTTTEDVVNGKAVLKKHHYMKLCDGVNFWDGHQWNESKEEINILPDGSGAEAVQGQLQAFFPSDIYEGVIRLVTADGKILQSRPVGLSYDDGSNTVMIAELTNSVGIVNSNEVVY